MPSQFDWQAEDESRWGDFEPEKNPSSPGRPVPRRLVVIALVLLTVLAGSAVAFGRIYKLIDGSTNDAEQAVLGVHNLVVSAAADGDSELLSGLILDRLHEWTAAQVMLADQGLLLDRRPLNLYLTQAAEPESVLVVLSNSLGRAEVTADYRYLVGSEEAGADDVLLRQQFTYRLEDEKWLLNPPTGAFWGSWQTTGGRYLTLKYPLRDEQLALRLAADLEAIVGQACHSVAELNCSADIHLSVNLVADPAVLVELADPASRYASGRSVILPAPTLLGVPVDESGYRAIYRAYASRIVAALVADQTGMTCCQPGMLGVALLDLILSRLGLTSWPQEPGSIPADSDEVLAMIETSWAREVPMDNSGSDDSWQSAYALAEFVATNWSTVPPAEMLRLQPQASSFEEWLAMLTPFAQEPSFAEAWHLFSAHDHPEAMPVAWPNQIILMMCDPGLIGSASLYRYDPAQSTWAIEMSGRELIHMEPLPDGSGVVLTEQLIRQDGQRMFLWQDGRVAPYYGRADEISDAKLGDPQRGTYSRPNRQSITAVWSNDGRWLAELGDGFLILSFPENGYSTLVDHSAEECRAIAWVEPTTQ